MSSRWVNRIVGYGEEAADQLLANDKNWRVHGKAQQEALTDVLESVGVVQNIIVNQRTGAVVDGHLRVSLALRQDGSQTLPITYVDLSEQEEALILSTLDPIAAMAAADKEQLDALLREVDTGSAALQEMLANLLDDAGIAADDAGDRTLEEIDAETLPERPVWCLITMPYAVMPEAMAALDTLRAIGARVEISGDSD